MTCPTALNCNASNGTAGRPHLLPQLLRKVRQLLRGNAGVVLCKRRDAETIERDAVGSGQRGSTCIFGIQNGVGLREP